MKIWQISACLESEQELFRQYFGDMDIIANGRNDVDEALTFEILGKSRRMFHLTSDGYLRLLPEHPYLKAKGIQTVKVLTIRQAFKEYGGNAITEVFDYGSFNVGIDKESQV